MTVRKATQRHSSARKRNQRDEGPITSSLIRKIKRLTNDNHATEAVLTLAKALGKRVEIKVLESIKTISDYENSTPYDLIMLRLKMLRSLLADAEHLTTPEQANWLYRAF